MRKAIAYIQDNPMMRNGNDSCNRAARCDGTTCSAEFPILSQCRLMSNNDTIAQAMTVTDTGTMTLLNKKTHSPIISSKSS
mmetsp:Transcript_11452/g.27353  ORF Transcript_11452/g.27353 Transcript_11452/m.27353 type:complete len:81 (-) Transcript_11452:850-1092(-)